MLHSNKAVEIQASYPQQPSTRHPRSTAAILFAAAALLIAPLAQAVFFTPGQFDVTPTGAASYTVPVAVPPGTAGMVPSLALAYNSQGGNGLLGVGWSLSGLSAVTRCPKTLIQDGAKGGIKYDATDKYCLDGQRLIAVSGAYGANGTEYRTEREGFSKIVSYGSNGYGPTNFKVWTKSGQIMEFGNTADSAIEAQGKAAIRVWAANKIADTKGNYLTITYTEDNPNGQYYPNRVDYTGNTAAGLAPYNSVRFVYATRPDITPMYDGGSKINTTVRLTNVQTYAKVNNVDAMVKDYRLAYGTSTSTQRSRLASLTECDGTTPSTTCLQPTALGWQNGGDGTSADGPIFLTTDTYGWDLWSLGDFNGDGKTDLVYHTITDYGKRIKFSNGNGTFTDSPIFTITDAASWDATYWTYGDFNGDGKTDIMYHTTTSYGKRIKFSNGDGTFTNGPIFTITDAASWLTTYWAYGDFNGDGKTDIMYHTTTPYGKRIKFSNGDGTFTDGPIFTITDAASWDAIYWAYGDFNGDGKTDIMYHTTTSYGKRIKFSNGDGTFTDGPIFLTTDSYGWSLWSLGDFNGDGKTDLVYHTITDYGKRIKFSNGNGTFTDSPIFTITDAASWDATYWTYGDFNGDGKTDIMYHTTTSYGKRIKFSNGDGTFTNGPIFTITDAASWLTTYWAYGDFNGDGKTDIMYHTTTSYGKRIKSSNIPGQSPDFLSTVTTGLGTTTAITYKPLTDSLVYSKDSGAVYPYVDLQVPQYVVSSVSSSNGIGGNYTSNYTYAGAKSHMTGGGFLGFRQTTSTDAQTGIKSITAYRQDYPYQGLPSSAEKRTSSNVLLNSVANTWAFATNPAWGAQYHAPQLTGSVESSYELTGALISTVTTGNTFDAYGNPTVITVSTPDGYSKTTTNSYTNDVVNWYLGRLTNATVTSTAP